MGGDQLSTGKTLFLLYGSAAPPGSRSRGLFRISGVKIAILHYSVPPVVGGVESVIAHHARLMTADGHAVRLVAARGESLSEQIPLIRVPLADSRHERVLKVKAQLDCGEVTAD